MNSELSEAARLLIRAALSEESKPGAAHRARLLSAVRERARLPEAQVGKAAQVAPWASASPLAPLSIFKVAAVTALGAGVGVATLSIAQIVLDPPAREHSATRAVASQPRGVAAEGSPIDLSFRLAPASSARPLQAATRANDATSMHASPTVVASPRAEGSAPHGATSHAPEPRADQEAPAVSSIPLALSAELALLKEVQGALRIGRARRALELVARHEREFPNGQLRNERLAAEVFAACQVGDVSRARSAAQRFLDRDASSPLAQRVKGACQLFPEDGSSSHD